MALAGLKRWFGRHLDAPPAPPGLALDLSAHPDGLPPAETSVWTQARLAVEEELWGDGYLTPGGAPELLRFSVPLGLSTASSLLVLGVGIGGPPQTLATDLGVWTAGFEADSMLAAIAGQRIQRAGVALAKRASVQLWNPAAPAFRHKFYHHALLLDPIRAALPERVLAAVESALKPHGQVVLVQTVAEHPLDPDHPAIAAWCRLEGRVPALPSADAINRSLSRLGYDIRIEEDMSARHMKLAVLGWKALLRRMKDARPGHARAAGIVMEAELWTRRIRLMHEGRIRMMRWHAIHRAGVH
jgi:hypothetical protein